MIPLSSWGFWAGFLSNADEIHVNAPPLHPLIESATRQHVYVYHNEKLRLFFGRFNQSAYDIEYRVDLNSPLYMRRNINEVSRNISSGIGEGSKEGGQG
ncbi:hypothetical protein EON64_15445, partial [archaeon]